MLYAAVHFEEKRIDAVIKKLRSAKPVAVTKLTSLSEKLVKSSKNWKICLQAIDGCTWILDIEVERKRVIERR